MSNRSPSPSEAFAALRARVRMEHGFYIAFTREPDGSFSWAVLTEMAAEVGDNARGGVADEWDDAKIAAVEDIYLPSVEGEARTE